MEKRLYRIQEGKVIAGVCGGIAQYLKIDPTVIRLIWALVSLSGAGILGYIIAIFIIPVKPLELGE